MTTQTRDIFNQVNREIEGKLSEYCDMNTTTDFGDTYDAPPERYESLWEIAGGNEFLIPEYGVERTQWLN